MNSIIKNILGKVTSRIYDVFCEYKNNNINNLLGGGKRRIQYPYHILGVENIIASENVSIGTGATIYTTRAKLIIKQHFVSGPNLTVITGDHMPMVGRFLDTILDVDKDRYDINHEYDQDVIIEEDVWCGANVTILKGVTIGRGAIIAAGSIVTKDIPPYCVAVGVPAKPIKMRWTEEQIKYHESVVYSKVEVDK